jgi:hypothetical protein
MSDTVEDITQLNVKALKTVKVAEPKKDPFSLEDGESGRYIVTLDGCGHCEEMKEKLKDKLDAGEIKEIHCATSGDGEDFENAKLMVTNDITAFPTILDVKKSGNAYEVCEKEAPDSKPTRCKLFNLDVADE